MLLRTVLSEAVLFEAAVVSRGVTWCSVPAFRAQIIAVYCRQLTAGHASAQRRRGGTHAGCPFPWVVPYQRLCCTVLSACAMLTAGSTALTFRSWSTPAE